MLASQDAPMHNAATAPASADHPGLQDSSEHACRGTQLSVLVAASPAAALGKHVTVPACATYAVVSHLISQLVSVVVVSCNPAVHPSPLLLSATTPVPITIAAHEFSSQPLNWNCVLSDGHATAAVPEKPD